MTSQSPRSGTEADLLDLKGDVAELSGKVSSLDERVGALELPAYEFDETGADIAECE